jgi:capsular polysaccharide transport system ATP-binding protein
MIVLENINTVKADLDNRGSKFDSLRNAYRFCGDDSRLYTHVGKRKARDIVSTGQVGCLLFGPYVPLAEGNYRVVLRGMLGELGADPVRMDVTLDKGNHILAESLINRPHQDDCLVSLPITLEAPCTDLEVRVWVEAHSQVTISMVEIQPCQTSELDSTDHRLSAKCLDILPQHEPPPSPTQQIPAVGLITAPPLVHESDIVTENRVGGTAMVVLENITKVYDTRKGPRTVLEGVSLRIAKGEKVGIIGRNGAGKSTLMRLISGAEPPTHGLIDRKMSVSWPLAFGGGFQGSLTGLDNLRFICRVYGVSYESVVPFVEEFSQLGSYLREPVKKYSSGMRSRLAFALSLAVEFDCFLIDEIIAVGDSRFHARCHEELFDKRKDRGMILVSHDPHMIRDYCDHAGVLNNGKLHMFDQVDDAFSFYQEYPG